MAKPKEEKPVPPGLQAARDASRATSENEAALAKMVRRLHVVADDHSGFVELHLDGEALYGGSGPDTAFWREFGRLIEAVKAEMPT